MTIEAKVRAAVLAAVETGGYPGVTYEGVAASSGVAKTTLYRRWPSKAELVFAMVMHGRQVRSLDCPPTKADACRVLADRVATFLGEGAAGLVMPWILLDMTKDPVLCDRLRSGALTEGRHEVEALLDRCQLTPVKGLEPGDVQEALLGAAQAWITLSNLPTASVRLRLEALADALLQARS